MASMVSERTTGAGAVSVISPHVVAMSTCGCGQALETCRAEHCPRCGVNLHLHS